MKPSTILYTVLLIGIVLWAFSKRHLLDSIGEGFEDLLTSSISEPIIPKGLVPAKTDTEAMPNPSLPGQLPFGPYAQMASVGSFQYQDPSMLPAELNQIKKLGEDIRSFLVFEGVNLADTSDPTVQLPLTQLRADSRKLQEEISVLEKNPGVQSQLTQQALADIDGSLMFLQKKVRLFETSGVVSGGTEGFKGTAKPDTKKPPAAKPDTKKPPAAKPDAPNTNKSGEKTKASKADLELLKKKTFAAILTLSASGTKDPVVQARIKKLQEMYTAVSDMVTKLEKGQWAEKDIPVYKEDIEEILPNLAKPQKNVKDVFSQGNGKKLNPIEQQLASLVGTENAQDVFSSLKERGMFRINMELGYNVTDKDGKGKKGDSNYKRRMDLQGDGSMKESSGINPHISAQMNGGNGDVGASMSMNLPFDTVSPGMDDRAAAKRNQPSGFDWKKRASTICEQIKLGGLNPEDFGCIPKNSLMSPAYSWRGHAKMVCGRLGTTMDPNLPIACGCPPQSWKGWTSSV